MKSKISVPKIEEGNFKDSIEKAISEGRHIDYLKGVLEEFEKYKLVMTNALTDQQNSNDIYCFKVVYTRSKKNIWRQFELIGTNTFEEFAIAIIESMGWDNDHMHGFVLRKIEGKTQDYYSPFSIYAPGWEDDPFPTYKTDEILISQIDYKKHPELNFVFDFGDGHEFIVTFLGTTTNKNLNPNKYPMLVDQRGVSPEQYPDWEDE